MKGNVKKWVKILGEKGFAQKLGKHGGVRRELFKTTAAGQKHVGGEFCRDENSAVCNCYKTLLRNSALCYFYESCTSAVPTNPHKFAFIRPRNYTSTNMASDVVVCV